MRSRSRFRAASMLLQIRHIPDPRRRWMPAAAPAACVCVTLLLAGCAPSGALRRGADAERGQDFDRAVAEYTQALRGKPDSTDARLGLERTRLRASQEHFTKARRLSALGKFDEA